MSSATLRRAFERAEAEGRAALVVYLTHGDPSISSTVDLMIALADAGADVIELGVPFSDPSADGVVIQQAMSRALAAGSGLEPALGTVREFRDRGHETPIVLFGYYNPLFVFGLSRFADAAQKAGVDAVLTVDLPTDELEELHIPLAEKDIGVVPLLAPTSTDERIAKVARFEPPFVYYVSMTGVTGSAFQQSTAGKGRVDEIRAVTRAPVAVGFGIKTGEDAKTVAEFADGVVVGSALVKRIAAANGPAGACSSIAELVNELRAAMPKR